MTASLAAAHPAGRSLPALRIPSEPDLFQQQVDPACLAMISPREAWDHLVLPLRIEAGILLCVTTSQRLVAAHDLISRVSDLPARYLLTETRPLEQFIAEQYAYEGVDIHEEVA